MARRDHGNGTRWALQYDGILNPAGDFGVKRVKRSTHSVIAGGAIVDDRSFTWDPNGNKSSMTDERLSQARTFLYDSADRLIASAGGPAGTVAYDLDGVGNRVEVGGGPDDGFYTMSPATPEPADSRMNQYTTLPFAGQASVALTHDKVGNTTALPFFDDAATTVVIATASYDAKNQMVRYERDGMLAEYRYDALGRRTAKTLTDDTGTTTTFFLYRGAQVIEEREAAGGASGGAAGKPVTATYVYGNGIDEVVTMRGAPAGGSGGPPVDYFYHADDQGTVWAVTDGSGAVVERYEYEDYGRSHALSPSGTPLSPTPNLSAASAIGNRIRYTGREFDEESGLY